MERQLREGVTTGSCAAGAALGSVLWQLEGECPPKVWIKTPAGRTLELALRPLEYGVCGVIKDAGDDPDVTDGCMVVAKVGLADTAAQGAPDADTLAAPAKSAPPRISFKAGEGVGIVTAPGLKVPVGEPAINPVPRQMITEAILPYLNGRSACVTISIPGGEALAKKTFNSRVGVEGGLSILGTSGIVRPMSEEAMKESLALELRVRISQGHKTLAFVLGAGGEQAVRELYGPGLGCVLVSNYMGFMLDEARALGVSSILVVGFAGKLVKLAADIMNTHSHVADGRRETLCTFAALAGAPTAVVREIYGCKTVQAAMDVIDHYGYGFIWTDIAREAARKCSLRVQGELEVAVVLLDKEKHILGQSGNAESAARGLRR